MIRMLKPYLLVLTAVIVAAAVTIGFGNSSHFTLTRFQIDGVAGEVKVSQIGKHVSGFSGENFFLVDVDHVKGHVEKVNWVMAANVTRVWPDTLKISVIEQVPFAHWARGGMVNPRGEVFHVKVPVEQGVLPEIDADRKQLPEAVALYGELKKMLAPLGVTPDLLALNQSGGATLVLDNGLRLLLGKRDRLEKIAKFVEVYPRIITQLANRVNAVDLRYPNGFAVDWKDKNTIPQREYLG